LEREYLNSKLSIRELAKKHNIKSYSTLASYARSHGWYDRRDRIKERTKEKVIERVSEQVAEAETDELMQFRADALAVARAAIYKYAQQIQDPMFTISTAELVKVVNVGLLILGEPTSRTEERRLELSGSIGELPPEFLRRLVEASRPGQALAGRTSAALPALVAGAREN
jgi:hypothetical protein